MTHTGGCACGRVRFEVSGDFAAQGACLCTDCQKAAGGGTNYLVLVPKDGFRVVKGEPASHPISEDVPKFEKMPPLGG